MNPLPNNTSVTVTGTAMDKEWSLKDLTVVVPFVATSFALAYVVGYFYAFDIAWFAYFSFPEHLVFALRVLPAAIHSIGC